MPRAWCSEHYLIHHHFTVGDALGQVLRKRDLMQFLECFVSFRRPLPTKHSAVHRCVVLNLRQKTTLSTAQNARGQRAVQMKATCAISGMFTAPRNNPVLYVLQPNVMTTNDPRVHVRNKGKNIDTGKKPRNQHQLSWPNQVVVYKLSAFDKGQEETYP